MRLVMRILGTWLLGLAVVLLIIDGTRSLAANAILINSLNDVWAVLHADSRAGVEAFIGTRLFGPLLADGFAALLEAPAALVAGVPGLLLAIVGRRRTPLRYVRADQI
jgi:hypothetical protein